MKKKKIIPIIIIVVLSAILAVEIIHFIKKDSAPVATTKPSGTTYINNQSSSDEKGIDLSSTYSQNDLEIKKEKIKVDGYNKDIEIVQISGLKDKKIENKINQEIRQRSTDYANSIIKTKDDSNNDFEFFSSAEANFANVLSVQVGSWNNYKEDFTGFNYNLATGEKLKFSDLFKKDEDLLGILRKIIYKGSADYVRDNFSFDGEGYEDIHFDSSKGAWYCKYSWYDEKTHKTNTETREYVLTIDEYEIEKYAKEFLANENSIFYFSPSRIVIKANKYKCVYFLKDIPDSVVIYNKYLTENSIFEKENKYPKTTITCSAERDFGIIKEAKYESDNFFYDISSIDRCSEGYSPNDYALQKEDELINNLKDRVNEYKQTAINNPNKAYFLFLQLTVQNGVSSYSSEDSNGNRNNESENNSLLCFELKQKLIVCNINEKDTLLQQVLNCYRYYNISFYYGIYDYLSVAESEAEAEYNARISGFSIDEKSEEKYYDVLLKEEYKSPQDIFLDELDYQLLLKHFTNEVEITDETTYSLDPYNFSMRDKNKKTDSLGYGSIRYYTKIKVLNMSDYEKEQIATVLSNYKHHEAVLKSFSNEPSNTVSNEVKTEETSNIIPETDVSDDSIDEIFPSNVRKIELSETENMTKDELYLAYNEIFARHGQDFKTKKFKDYFSQKDWYHPIEGKSVELSELNEIEVYNANLLKNAADSK